MLYKAKQPTEAFLISSVTIKRNKYGNPEFDLTLEEGNPILGHSPSGMAPNYPQAGDYYVNTRYYWQGQMKDSWRIIAPEDFLAQYEPVTQETSWGKGSPDGRAGVSLDIHRETN